MIFSNKIYKIVDGENVSLYAESSENLILYIYNKSLRKYYISSFLNRNCVFIKNYNYSKIIQINQDLICIASNGNSSLVYEKNI